MPRRAAGNELLRRVLAFDSWDRDASALAKEGRLEELAPAVWENDAEWLIMLAGNDHPFVVRPMSPSVRVPKDGWLVVRAYRPVSAAAGSLASGLWIGDGQYADAILAQFRGRSLRFLALEDFNLSDRGMAAIGSMRGVDELYLAGMHSAHWDKLRLPQLGKMTVKAMAPTDTDTVVCGQADLEKLTLRDAAVSDRVMDCLCRMKGLRRLHLQFTDVDDRRMERLLASLTLELLDLHQSTITDATLSLIKRQGRLTSLNLSRCAITDTGLKRLEGHRTLERIDLGNTEVTDRGIDSLTKLPALHSLNLAGTRVTPACYPALARIKTLRGLTLRGTQADIEPLRWLQAQLPECEIR